MKKILLLWAVLLTALGMNAQTTPPSSAQKSTWNITFSFHDAQYGDQNDTEKMTVAFDENDIYFYFPNTITGNSWMKGTREGSLVTFEKGQRIGSYANLAYYFMGVSGSDLCDILFTYDEENGVFTLGDMYIAQNASLTEVAVNGYFSSATITKTDDPDVPVLDDEAVTPPAGVEQTDYSFFAVYHAPETEDEELDETVKVAVDGSTVYLQFPNPVNGLTWIVGTIVDETVVFPVQYLGTNGGQKFYITGRNENDVIGDIVFSYSESLMVCNDQWIQICDDKTGQNVYAYYSTTMVVKPGEDDPVVEAPAGLQATPYVFSAYMAKTDDEGNYAGYEEVKRDVRAGFYNNTEVYIQGLCTQLPEAWVKGTVTGESFGDKVITFKAGQCYGKYGLSPLYMVAQYHNALDDMMFYYDPQTRVFENMGGYYLVLNGSKSSPMAYELCYTVKLTPGSSSGIDGVADSESAASVCYGLDGRRHSASQRGLNIIRMSDGTVRKVMVK